MKRIKVSQEEYKKIRNAAWEEYWKVKKAARQELDKKLSQYEVEK